MSQSGSVSKNARSRIARHKPALSIDSSLYATTRSVSDSSIPRSVPKRAVPRSFVKIRGSIHGLPSAGIPADLHRKRYSTAEPHHSNSDSDSDLDCTTIQSASTAWRVLPDGRSDLGDEELFSTNETPTPPHQRRVNDSGPLLQRTTENGSKLTLSLDRAIHYRASPSAACAWTYHEYQEDEQRSGEPAESRESSFDSRLVQPATSLDSSGSNPEDAPPETTDPRIADERVAFVPRLLLAFTLDIQPELGLRNSTRPRENFEFVALQLDFWSASTIVSANEVHSNSYTRTKLGNRRSVRSCDMPLVRGFAASDIATTGFLQSFGPTLYESIQDPASDPSRPIVLGAGEQHYVYKSFEQRISRLTPPVVINGNPADRIAARGSDDPTCTVPATPMSAGFVSGSSVGFPGPRGDQHHPLPSTPICERPAYGTSSVRVMVKRDTRQESAWSQTKVPFILLVEYPPNTPAVEAKIRLDMSTVKKNLPGVTRRESMEPSPPVHRQVGSSTTPRQLSRSQTDPNVAAMVSPTASNALTRHSSHATNLSSSSSRSSNPSVGSVQTAGREEDEEFLVKVYPRQDPVSVVTCGGGTVRDTLYPTGVVRPSKVQANLDGKPLPPKPKSTRRFSASPEQGLGRGPPMVRPKMKLPGEGHSRTQSEMILPGQYIRFSGSPEPMPPKAGDREGQRRSYAPLVQAPRAVRRDGYQEGDIDELFDMVLTTWTTNKLKEN